MFKTEMTVESGNSEMSEMEERKERIERKARHEVQSVKLTCFGIAPGRADCLKPI